MSADLVKTSEVTFEVEDDERLSEGADDGAHADLEYGESFHDEHKARATELRARKVFNF